MDTAKKNCMITLVRYCFGESLGYGEVTYLHEFRCVFEGIWASVSRDGCKVGFSSRICGECDVSYDLVSQNPVHDTQPVGKPVRETGQGIGNGVFEYRPDLKNSQYFECVS